jgi:UDP-N-acetylmuramoyl-tripeptide--D-alanyl-D-alanine ligase
VLGDMGEVGEQGPAFHTEVGAYAAERGIHQLLTTGALASHSVSAFEQSGGGTACHFSDAVALIAALPDRLELQGAVLVKGSRFMKMERVVQAIEALAQPAQSPAGEKGSHAA